VDVRKKVKEAREGNNCRGLGTLRLEIVEPPGDDLDYQPGQTFFHSFDGGGYYGYVSLGYDPNQPTALLVWLHGCQGRSEYDIGTFHANDAQSFVTIAPIGAENGVGGSNGCWRTPPAGQGDEQRVMNAAYDAAGHFNLDPDKLVLGGYSSGGDLAYRTGYLFSDQVDAVLAANSAPFRDTGITPAVLQTGITKFRVVHLAHTEDTTYPVATVRSELKQLTDAGFPVTSIERPGTHYDEPAQGVPGTDLDIVNLLLPQVNPPN
jgi:predicted esterase